MGDFADGLKQFFNRSPSSRSVMLTKKRAQILLDLIGEIKLNLQRYIEFQEDDDAPFSAEEDRFLAGLAWLEGEANKRLGKEVFLEIILTPHITRGIKRIIDEYKYEPEGTELDKILCWMYNQLSRRWSENEICMADFTEPSKIKTKKIKNYGNK